MPQNPLSDGHESDVERGVYERAQKLLKDHHCDLLISGRVKGRSSDNTVLSLRFTVAEAEGRKPENYTLTETFDLPANFVGHLGAAISARVAMSAAPAVQMGGQYLVPTMRAVAERLEPIVTRLNLAFHSDTRGSLLFNYALVLPSIGQQAGPNDALQKAIVAYRAALLEWTRKRVPLDWAGTQNNLGTALKALGERESGTEKLEEAVAVFRAALLERTRERVPLAWAATQNNLGTALKALGARESGTEKLEEAVEAYRAALLEWTRERVPPDWAMTQNNLGAALEIYEAAKASYYVDHTRRNHSRAESLLAERRSR